MRVISRQAALSRNARRAPAPGSLSRPLLRMWARHCRCCALHVRSALPPPGPPALPEAPRSTSSRALHATGQIVWRPHWAPARQWPPIAALSGPRRCLRCPAPARGQHMSSRLIPETTRRAPLWFVVVRLHREPQHRGARACRPIQLKTMSLSIQRRLRLLMARPALDPVCSS